MRQHENVIAKESVQNIAADNTQQLTSNISEHGATAHRMRVQTAEQEHIYTNLTA